MPVAKKKAVKKVVAKITKDITKKEWNQERAIKEVDKMMREHIGSKLDEQGIDNDQGIDVPLHLRGGEFHWNFEKRSMPWYDKVTWILAAVNVAIFVTLLIKNLN